MKAAAARKLVDRASKAPFNIAAKEKNYLITISKQRIKGRVVTVFGRTEFGQTLYDILMSRMSAAECARRHRLSRSFVLDLRRAHRQGLRKNG